MRQGDPTHLTYTPTSKVPNKCTVEWRGRTHPCQCTVLVPHDLEGHHQPGLLRRQRPHLRVQQVPRPLAQLQAAHRRLHELVVAGVHLPLQDRGLVLRRATRCWWPHTTTRGVCLFRGGNWGCRPQRRVTPWIRIPNPGSVRGRTLASTFCRYRGTGWCRTSSSSVRSFRARQMCWPERTMKLLSVTERAGRTRARGGGRRGTGNSLHECHRKKRDRISCVQRTSRICAIGSTLRHLPKSIPERAH